MNLIKPMSFKLATLEEIRTNTNGVGPEGLEKLIPDTIWLLNITPAARVHDWMYNDIENGVMFWNFKATIFGDSCHTMVSRGLADIIFMVNVLIMIDNAKGFEFVRWLRRYRAMTYFNFVSTFGAFTITKTKKHGGSNMKKVLLSLMAVLIIVLGLAGCRRNQAVNKAAIERDAIVSVGASNNDVFAEVLIESLRKSDLKRVDTAVIYENVKADTIAKEQIIEYTDDNGKIDTSAAIIIASKHSEAKERVRKKSDKKKTEINEVYDILNKARKNNAINYETAKRLNDVIRKYDNASVDPVSVSVNAATQIRDILKDAGLLKGK